MIASVPGSNTVDISLRNVALLLNLYENQGFWKL
jgi:hypothetical protein